MGSPMVPTPTKPMRASTGRYFGPGGAVSSRGGGPGTPREEDLVGSSRDLLTRALSRAGPPLLP